MNNKQKLILLSAGAILLGILVFSLFTYIGRSGKLGITISVVPKDSKITIDDKKAGSGKVYVSRGTHTFKASKEGHKDATTTVAITQAGQIVYLLPEPTSKEATDRTKSDSEYQMEREALAGAQTDQEGRALQEKNPILNMLPQPFNQKRYAIDYEISNRSKTGVVLQITAADPEARRYALEDIKSWGYDVSDLYIEFDDFKNPLTQGKD